MTKRGEMGQISRRISLGRMDKIICRSNLITRIWLLALCFTTMPVARVSSQEVVGTDICACTPTTYTFTLDFNRTCPPLDIPANPGILTSQCLINTFDPDIDDLVPVVVNKIDISELGQGFNEIIRETIDADFEDGDTFAYTSVTAVTDNLDNTNDIPLVLELTLEGQNALAETVVNRFLITFTNECGAAPVFERGVSAGWAVFSELSGPREELCPSPPSTTPSLSPTLLTEAPTSLPTANAPIIPPAATPIPTTWVSNNPTAMPSNSPSSAPSHSPTSTPSTFPSLTPSLNLPDTTPTDPPSTPMPSPSPTVKTNAPTVTMDKRPPIYDSRSKSASKKGKKSTSSSLSSSKSTKSNKYYSISKKRSISMEERSNPSRNTHLV